jgi:hypothetical protein
MPRDLCKQEVSTLGVWSRGSRVLEGLANERHKKVWGERNVRASLHRTIPHPWEMWDLSLQTWPASWSSWHLPHVAIEKNAWRHLWTLCFLKWHRSRLTCCTPSTQSKSWIRRIVSQGIKQSSSTRYNGATILKKKQLGKVRLSSFYPFGLRVAIVRKCATVRCFY